MNTIRLINKEDIPSVKFVSYEVLDKESDKLLRRELIEKAMILGNSSKGKSKIFFMSEDGLLEVETTVWQASDDLITLKGGLMIPVHCIERIELL
ncbi:MAG: hypothetical protein H3C45_05425 [Bacteroidia bacterium]|nr:hypothetical protein [Bacteroidia bacterium]MCC7532595.1 hypothetical protein [Bacteroidia bacterium]MCZ2140071.1 hypothetical protein [Bacteroidia bacterium]